MTDVSPPDVNVDVGAMYFKGETAEFYVQAVFKRKPIDATFINATLYTPDGTTQTLTYKRVATGLYKVHHTISGRSSMAGTYALVVEAGSLTDIFNAYGTSLKTFIVKSS